LFEIIGFWPKKRGSGPFVISGKFSVIGGVFGRSLFSNQFLPAKTEPTSLSGS